ncbi:Aldolase [Glarea lozoyensis ATCC 20868]|uniref:Aldolase n=1 Tax=Glarea lozoyensis (strain ATCC 20868 / MF5171) TaxID=1116229 RepID=S3DUQ6_GLAL2|nr:Aldolase [Glarea lozoyensis ATCC 20868]EPE30158.1 Aldolase [Glarea lozoyensis ATCC 20868]
MGDANGSNGSSNGNGTNGHSTRRPLLPGIYAPTMTFFQPENEDLDIPIIKKHAIRLAEAGLVGLVTMGSNGEAVHLSPSEKTAVTRATREALDSAGFTQVPIIVGATEGSVRGTIALIAESAKAGGDYVLLLPPSYFRGLMDEDSVYNYFTQVADEAVLPLILYNYPGAVAGIDMDSDLLIRLAKHPNIIGTKFTCGNTGKLTRVALATDAKTPFSEGSGYMAFGGMCDFTAQTLISGGSGIIAGGANVMPKTCVKIWNLYTEGKRDEAFALQKVLSKGDWVLTKAAIAGTKSAIQSYYGYGGFPRRPLKRLDEVRTKGIKEGIDEVMKVELGL